MSGLIFGFGSAATIYVSEAYTLRRRPRRRSEVTLLERSNSSARKNVPHRTRGRGKHGRGERRRGSQWRLRGGTTHPVRRPCRHPSRWLRCMRPGLGSHGASAAAPGGGCGLIGNLPGHRPAAFGALTSGRSANAPARFMPKMPVRMAAVWSFRPQPEADHRRTRTEQHHHDVKGVENPVPVLQARTGSEIPRVRQGVSNLSLMG